MLFQKILKNIYFLQGNEVTYCIKERPIKKSGARSGHVSKIRGYCRPR